VSEWVTVAAAAVGAAPGLVVAYWARRGDSETRRDDLVRAAVRDLIAESISAASHVGPLPFVVLDDRMRRIAVAKAEFDLLVDTQPLHDAAGALLEGVSAYLNLTTSGTPSAAAQSEAAESLKQARLTLVHEVRKVMPGLVVDERRWLRGRN
jgi:hypothetical protein